MYIYIIGNTDGKIKEIFSEIEKDINTIKMNSDDFIYQFYITNRN